MRAVLALLGFLAATLVAGGVAGFMTVPEIAGWYHHLNRPVWTPPDWLFGPAWTILYIAIAFAAWLVWRLPPSPVRRLALGLWWVQLVVNFFWSPLFFNLHFLWLAQVDVLLMIVLTVLTIREFYRVSKPGARIMLPYLVWVCYASTLNAGILWLNP